METFKGFGQSNMTIDGMRRFVRYGKAGEWVTYFTGSALPYRPGSMWEVAWELYKAGYIVLAQKRLEKGETGVGKFEYMACRTGKEWEEVRQHTPKTRVLARI